MTNSTSRSEVPVFGIRDPNTHYQKRRAAYVVVIENGNLAVVGSGQSYFLPGGGSLKGESAKETVLREVQEELGRSVRLTCLLGESTQYFYSNTDDRHYEMKATFFAGEFADATPETIAEHILEWMPLAKASHALFHQCHQWAIQQACLLRRRIPK